VKGKRDNIYLILEISVYIEFVRETGNKIEATIQKNASPFIP
jgi:hypothetical protein